MPVLIFANKQDLPTAAKVDAVCAHIHHTHTHTYTPYTCTYTIHIHHTHTRNNNSKDLFSLCIPSKSATIDLHWFVPAHHPRPPVADPGLLCPHRRGRGGEESRSLSPALLRAPPSIVGISVKTKSEETTQYVDALVECYVPLNESMTHL